MTGRDYTTLINRTCFNYQLINCENLFYVLTFCYYFTILPVINSISNELGVYLFVAFPNKPFITSRHGRKRDINIKDNGLSADEVYDRATRVCHRLESRNNMKEKKKPFMHSSSALFSKTCQTLHQSTTAH